MGWFSLEQPLPHKIIHTKKSILVGDSRTSWKLQNATKQTGKIQNALKEDGVQKSHFFHESLTISSYGTSGNTYGRPELNMKLKEGRIRHPTICLFGIKIILS